MADRTLACGPPACAVARGLPCARARDGAQGIETVRRDNCSLVKEVVDTCLRLILIEQVHAGARQWAHVRAATAQHRPRSPLWLRAHAPPPHPSCGGAQNVQGAVSYVKGVISDLLMNRIDLSMLVISKALTRSADAFDNKQAHVELAGRIAKRDPGMAPNIGDRIPYVIIKGPKGAKAFEKSEDPIYVLENNIPIDTRHYLEHQLAEPLKRHASARPARRARSPTVATSRPDVRCASPPTAPLAFGCCAALLLSAGSSSPSSSTRSAPSSRASTRARSPSRRRRPADS